MNGQKSFNIGGHAYQNIQFIGCGAHAVAFKCFQVNDQRTVTLRIEPILTDEDRERIDREMQIVILEHPNIQQVYY